MHRFDEVSGDVGKGGQKEVSKIVALESAAGVESILKQPAEQSFVLGEGHHAITNVAGREDTVFAAKAAGAAAVIRNGDNGGQISDGTLQCRERVMAGRHEVFQAAQESGEAGAAAESDNIQTASDGLVFPTHAHSRKREARTAWRTPSVSAAMLSK